MGSPSPSGRKKRKVGFKGSSMYPSPWFAGQSGPSPWVVPILTQRAARDGPDIEMSAHASRLAAILPQPCTFVLVSQSGFSVELKASLERAGVPRVHRIPTFTPGQLLGWSSRRSNGGIPACQTSARDVLDAVANLASRAGATQGAITSPIPERDLVDAFAATHARQVSDNTTLRLVIDDAFDLGWLEHVSPATLAQEAKDKKDADGGDGGGGGGDDAVALDEDGNIVFDEDEEEDQDEEGEFDDGFDDGPMMIRLTREGVTAHDRAGASQRKNGNTVAKAVASLGGSALPSAVHATLASVLSEGHSRAGTRLYIQDGIRAKTVGIGPDGVTVFTPEELAKTQNLGASPLPPPPSSSSTTTTTSATFASSSASSGVLTDSVGAQPFVASSSGGGGLPSGSRNNHLFGTSSGLSSETSASTSGSLGMYGPASTTSGVEMDVSGLGPSSSGGHKLSTSAKPFTPGMGVGVSMDMSSMQSPVIAVPVAGMGVVPLGGMGKLRPVNGSMLDPMMVSGVTGGKPHPMAQARPQAGYVCYNCGTPGGLAASHFKERCPYPRSSVPHGGYRCFQCGAIDSHWVHDCPTPGGGSTG